MLLLNGLLELRQMFISSLMIFNQKVNFSAVI